MLIPMRLVSSLTTTTDLVLTVMPLLKINEIRSKKWLERILEVGLGSFYMYGLVNTKGVQNLKKSLKF